MGLQQYPAFLASGLVSYFGSPLVAVPFLLNIEHIPADTFQLFVAAGVYLDSARRPAGRHAPAGFDAADYQRRPRHVSPQTGSPGRCSPCFLGVDADVHGRNTSLPQPATSRELTTMMIASNMQLPLHPSLPLSHRTVADADGTDAPDVALAEIHAIPERCASAMSPTNLPFSFFNRQGSWWASTWIWPICWP